jgi:hypothetical protein
MDACAFLQVGRRGAARATGDPQLYTRRGKVHLFQCVPAAWRGRAAPWNRCKEIRHGLPELRRPRADLDIIVAIVTGSTLSRALTGNADLFGTLAATTLLMVLHWALSRACSRWPRVSRMLEPSGAITVVKHEPR